MITIIHTELSKFLLDLISKLQGNLLPYGGNCFILSSENDTLKITIDPNEFVKHYYDYYNNMMFPKTVIAIDFRVLLEYHFLNRPTNDIIIVKDLN